MAWNSRFTWSEPFPLGNCCSLIDVCVPSREVNQFVCVRQIVRWRAEESSNCYAWLCCTTTVRFTPESPINGNSKLPKNSPLTNDDNWKQHLNYSLGDYISMRWQTVSDYYRWRIKEIFSSRPAATLFPLSNCWAAVARWRLLVAPRHREKRFNRFLIATTSFANSPRRTRSLIVSRSRGKIVVTCLLGPFFTTVPLGHCTWLPPCLPGHPQPCPQPAFGTCDLFIIDARLVCDSLFRSEFFNHVHVKEKCSNFSFRSYQTPC